VYTCEPKKSSRWELLNGFFGVTQDERAGPHEVLRLIMNLTPLNGIMEPITGNVEMPPMWSLMTPDFIQPDETLLVSSEEVRCFFYTMSVPSDWWKFLAFNRRVPDQCLPAHLKGDEVYLASRVLPMDSLIPLAWPSMHTATWLCGVASMHQGLGSRWRLLKVKSEKIDPSRWPTHLGGCILTTTTCLKR
jgi:hypothetical protein